MSVSQCRETFRILRRIETSATLQHFSLSMCQSSFQNPATDRDLCYLAHNGNVTLPTWLSESCDGSRPLLRRQNGCLWCGSAAFRILRRIETSATLVVAPGTLRFHGLSESCDGSRPLLPERDSQPAQQGSDFQNPATDRDLCYTSCSTNATLHTYFQNPATDRDLCYALDAIQDLLFQLTFRILRRIETSATFFLLCSFVVCKECFQNPATDRDLCYLSSLSGVAVTNNLTFRILRRIETSATHTYRPLEDNLHTNFQNPATDGDLCYSQFLGFHSPAQNFQNPATDRDLCYRNIHTIIHPHHNTFRILRRIETSATSGVRRSQYTVDGSFRILRRIETSAT